VSIEEAIQLNRENLSERCRIALEKDLGFKIPLPKSAVKSVS
jgi:hypothetical protein